MAEQMEDVGMGFLDMEGDMPEPPEVSQGNPLQELGIRQVGEVMKQVMSRFEGGLEQVIELVESDKQDILDYKESKGQYDGLKNTIDISKNPDEDPTKFMNAPVPGSSLVGNLQDSDKGTLGVYPWETPPELESIVDAFQFITERKNEEPHKENILKLLYSGVPVEALSRTLSFKGFLEGLWTPDISELLIIPTMLEFMADAQDDGFEARIFNDFNDDEIDQETVLSFLKEFKPDEYNNIKQDADMLVRMEANRDDTGFESEPMTGSFLDMEVEE